MIEFRIPKIRLHDMFLIFNVTNSVKYIALQSSVHISFTFIPIGGQGVACGCIVTPKLNTFILKFIESMYQLLAVQYCILYGEDKGGHTNIENIFKEKCTFF